MDLRPAPTLAQNLPLFLGLVLMLSPPPLYADTLSQFLESYCIKCHGSEKKEADIDLRGPHLQLDLLKHKGTWSSALDQIEFEDMPPKGPYPTAEERAQAIHLLENRIKNVDWAKFHDPGRSPMARLTQIEYRNAIRDIFGIDFLSGSLLGRDPEGNTGFTNDRETLSIPLFALDGFLQEAERATDAFLPYADRDYSQTYSLPERWRSYSDKSTALSEDESAVILAGRALPFSWLAEVPSAGMYELSVTASTQRGEPISGMTVAVNGSKVGKVIVQGESPQAYTVLTHLPAGGSVITFGFHPTLAPLIQKTITPRRVPDKWLRMVEPNPVPEMDVPPQLQGKKEAEKAIQRLNNVMAGYKRTQDLAQLLVEQGKPDFENHSLKGQASSGPLGSFQTSKVAFNLAAGKVATLLEVPQAELEKQLHKELGFSHGDFAKSVRRYREAFAKKHPDRVRKVHGEIALTKARISTFRPSNSGLEAVVLLSSTLQNGDPSELLALLGRRAYGRTLDHGELALLLRIYQRTTKETGQPKEGLRDAITGLLISPPFLLRYTQQEAKQETDSGDLGLAKRLASFLWLSLPDEELIQLAEAGQLRSPAVLNEQVTRMLASPKFEAFSNTFMEQWLDLASLQHLEDAGPLEPHILDAMQQEPAATLTYIIRENRSLLELVAADYAFLNASLASHYDIRGVSGHDLHRVTLSTDQRGGLFTMAAPLAATSTEERTSPVMRGVWIAEQVLGVELPPAPPSVPELKTNNEARTIREELEAHRSEKACAGCHDKIDPFGFVLENFDQFGKWRNRERGKVIDASTELPDGTEIDGLAEFQAYILEKRADDFLRNLTKKMMEFALGRELRFSDEATLQNIIRNLKEDGSRSRRLIQEIVLSDQFQLLQESP